MTNYLADDIYKIVTESVPIVCVDLIPVQYINNVWQIGIITRDSGSQTGKPALIGGRVWKDEAVEEAIARHLENDLGVKQFSFYTRNNIERPFRVQQYEHGEPNESRLPSDPTKQSISLTYLIEIVDKPKPKNEASEFYWISAEEVPSIAAFNQNVVMKQAFDFLDQTYGGPELV